jgi:polyphosphate kinase
MTKIRKKRESKKKKPEDLLPDEQPQEFFNREIEWLEFNARVLHEALDVRTPLLERAKFLGIFNSNLDEFFMKRVGGLKHRVEANVQRKSGGMTPLQSLAAVRAKVLPMLEMQAQCFRKVLLPELAKNAIQLLKWPELTSGEKDFADQFFKSHIFPVLTPLAVDPGLPFPFISNLSTSFGITLKHPEREEKLFARMKVPKIFPQWLRVYNPAQPQNMRFVSLIDVMSENLKTLFPDMEVLGIMPFRITRNAEVESSDDDADDLLEMVVEEVKQRRFAEVVRLEHGPNPDPWMLQFLLEELELTHSEVYELSELLDYTDLKAIADLPLEKLKYEVWNPIVPQQFQDEQKSIFDVIKSGDLLVHHPYESFSGTVEKFIRCSVEDPLVLAIKMTLYRTGDNSPFIPLLIRAAEAGKQVVVLIELKARFDEERNIHWAQELENAGVHVVYGVVGLKTHAKTTLVVRNEPAGPHCYVHLGTGNYHKETSKLYTDIGYFTDNAGITQDVVELFHFLTGRSLKREYRKLLVAPVSMRENLLSLIQKEIQNAKVGKPAHIIIKCNSLDESVICRALYDASRAGVKIDLIVRGFCCLRPGVPGMSENIKVYSIIGRFLEHSRIFYFANAETDPAGGIFYIGSADLMYRNLLARIETLVPIEPRDLRDRLWEVLTVMLNDHRSKWTLQSDGSYIQAKPTPHKEDVGTHQHLMKLMHAQMQPSVLQVITHPASHASGHHSSSLGNLTVHPATTIAVPQPTAPQAEPKK